MIWIRGEKEMIKKIKTGIVVILIVAMFIVTVFSGSVIASTSGDEHRTSDSKRLGDDNGESSVEPERKRDEDRTRMEDT